MRFYLFLIYVNYYYYYSRDCLFSILWKLKWNIYVVLIWILKMYFVREQRLLWEMGTSAFVWSAFVKSQKKCGWLCFVIVNEMGSDKRRKQINESMWNILDSFTWLNSDFNWNYRVWGPVDFWLRRIFWSHKHGTWMERQTSIGLVNLELTWPCYIVCSVTSHKIWFFFPLIRMVNM